MIFQRAQSCKDEPAEQAEISSRGLCTTAWTHTAVIRRRAQQLLSTKDKQEEAATPTTTGCGSGAAGRGNCAARCTPYSRSEP